MKFRRFALTVSLLLCAVAASAAPVTPEAHLGYPLGSRFTQHHQIVSWFDELARASPLVSVQRYGESYQGRPLLHAVITSERNHERLDQIRQQVLQLRSGTIAASRAEQIAAELPVVVWLAFGIHGNESSSSEAAIAVAAALASDEAAMQQLLERVVIIIDPVQNPDGRERYVQNFKQRRGKSPNPDPAALEHREPWPGGRYNHYLIDLNRDWAWASQQETRARIAAYRQWEPPVFVDLHEMTYESSYFFPPDAQPININVPPDTERWLERFGRANAAAFSARQWPFFVGERFDLFYPGYGDSWPSLRGSIGMTYEMAGGGRAGLVIRRGDETLLTLAERIERHSVAALTTVATAARNRQELLMHSWRSAQQQTERGTQTYLLPDDSPGARRAVELMLLQGVEVGRLRAPLRLNATGVHDMQTAPRQFRAGTWVIRTAQPLGGLVQTMFERMPDIREDFIREQRERVEADQPDEFYDITSWSLPLAMNFDAWMVEGRVQAEPMLSVRGEEPSLPGAAYGWIVSPESDDFHRMIGRMLSAGVRFSVSRTALGGDGGIPRGALVIERHRNGEEIERILARITSDLSLQLTGTDRVWAAGPALGSNLIQFVRDPQIAVVAGDDVDPASFGMIWHTLDQQLEIPHTVIPAAALATADLQRFRVIVLPDGRLNLAERLGTAGLDNFRAWVRAGGSVVAIKGGAAALRRDTVGLSKVVAWTPETEEEEQPAEVRRFPHRVPGAAFETFMNERSYLTLGIEQAPPVILLGTEALSPLPRRADNIVMLSDDPLIGGLAWPEAVERVSGTAWMIRERVGSGTIITFADEPHFRLFWRGTLPLFVNAVVYSATFAQTD
jgi:hypothetical protein